MIMRLYRLKNKAEYPNPNKNRVTPELRIFWLFLANPGVQINVRDIAQINGKYIKHVGGAPRSYNQ